LVVPDEYPHEKYTVLTPGGLNFSSEVKMVKAGTVVNALKEIVDDYWSEDKLRAKEEEYQSSQFGIPADNIDNITTGMTELSTQPDKVHLNEIEATIIHKKLKENIDQIIKSGSKVGQYNPTTRDYIH